MAFVRGFGHYLPARVVANEELALRLGVTPEFIELGSGIRERRYAEEGQTVADLAVEAGRECLKNCGCDAASIGMVVLSSGTGEWRFPGPASTVASGLGMTDVPAIDVPVASAGSLIALIQANAFADAHRRVLVIAAEKFSSLPLDGADPGTAMLFGDGAGACLVDAESGMASILDYLLASDGSFADALKLEREGSIVMDGRTVILQVSRKLPRAVLDVLRKHSIQPESVHTYLLHQANANLIRAISRQLNVPEHKFFMNVSRYGNTSSASLLISASEWSESASLRAGDPIVFSAFGAGFHWGCLLARAT
jgi:3-oxoacyl-[acyl-carrier-protein] synthase III